MDYVILCLIHPRPYCHVYFVLAALRHLRRAIRLATAQSPTNQQQQPQQLAVFLQVGILLHLKKETEVTDFLRKHFAIFSIYRLNRECK